jgi:hypothetical protein
MAQNRYLADQDWEAASRARGRKWSIRCRCRELAKASVVVHLSRIWDGEEREWPIPAKSSAALLDKLGPVRVCWCFQLAVHRKERLEIVYLLSRFESLSLGIVIERT